MDKVKILNNLKIPEFYRDHVEKFHANGNGQGKGCCPFHPDEKPSLSVNFETGQYFCHVCNDGGDLFKFYMRHKQVDFKEALSQLSEYSGLSGEKVSNKIECVYRYTDESGTLLFEVVRYTPKTFRQRRPDGKGGHVYNLDGVRIVPYNLPAIIASDTVYICEGEKDCDNLAKLGLAATTNPMGAGKWREEFGQYFTGKDVVIICDKDEIGLKHGQDVAKKLNGHVRTIKLIEQLPGVPLKGDVSYWLKLPDNDKEKLMEIVKNTSLWTPKECEKYNSTMVLTRLNSLFQEPEEAVTWLVDGLFPSGGFSIIAAKPKVGKSTTARNLALNIARNEPFLGRNVSQGAVIYLALEEKRSEVKKHFRAMGAIGSEDIHIYTGGAPVDAIKQITLVVESLKPVLLIIDPLFRLVKLKDGNDYIQVTNALEPLLRLARDTGTHVLCVHHSPKGERNPEDCVLGSQAIFGSVDTLMIMKRHENYRTLQTIQRYGEDLEETVLNYDKGEGSVTVGNTRQEQDTNFMEESIIDFLSKQNEPVTEKAINEEVEGRTILKRKALRELIKQNKIVRSGKGGKGDPYKYSCSQKNACSHLGNESGNNKKSEENHQEKNACSLVPRVGQEQQNNNIKIAETLGGCREDSCSRVPVFPETEKNCREQAFLEEIPEVEGVIKIFPIGTIIKLPVKAAEIFIQQGKLVPVFELVNDLNERMCIMGENCEPGQVEPYVTEYGVLVIPWNSPKRFHYWNKGQSVCETLRELGRCDLIEKYKSLYLDN